LLDLDVAYNILDYVLDRHQTFGTAELVDDDRKMDALTPHPREELDDTHRLGHEQGIAHQRGQRAIARNIDVGDEDILDVKHADHLIEALAIDWQAAVASVGECLDQLIEADIRGHGDDVAPRDRDLACRLVAEMQQVAQHLAFGRREVPGNRARLLSLLDCFLDLTAERRLAVLAEDQVTHAAPQA